MSVALHAVFDVPPNEILHHAPQALASDRAPVVEVRTRRSRPADGRRRRLGSGARGVAGEDEGRTRAAGRRPRGDGSDLREARAGALEPARSAAGALPRGARAPAGPGEALPVPG